MLRWLQSDRQSRQNVGDSVHSKDLTCSEWNPNAKQARAHDQAKFAQVASQQESKRTANVAPEAAPFNKRLDQCREIIISNHQISRLTGNLSAAAAHSHTNIGQAQSRSIID